MTSRSVAPGASCRQERFVSLQRFVVQSILLTALNYTCFRRRVGESPARLASAAATAEKAAAVPCRLVVWNDCEAADAWSLVASVMYTGCVSGEVERRNCVEGHMIDLVHATTVPSGHGFHADNTLALGILLFRFRTWVTNQI